MRSQQEILNKIAALDHDRNDPMGVQRKHLIRKLEWNNAVKWISPSKISDIQFKKNWEMSSRLDEKYLLKEMKEFMFAAYGAWLDREPMECLVMVQYYIIWIWLMGPKEESFLGYILGVFQSPDNNMGRRVFDEICLHYGWKVKTFMREFEEKERNAPKIITPDDIGGSGLILPTE